jgi:hypothetical protein
MLQLVPTHSCCAHFSPAGTLIELAVVAPSPTFDNQPDWGATGG